MKKLLLIGFLIVSTLSLFAQSDLAALQKEVRAQYQINDELNQQIDQLPPDVLRKARQELGAIILKHGVNATPAEPEAYLHETLDSITAINQSTKEILAKYKQ